MSIFTGTVDYYRRYRPGIPDTVAEILDQAVTSRPPRRLLDVATGTGLVVEALLGRFNDIIAIDHRQRLQHARRRGGSPAPGAAPWQTLVLAETTAEDFTPPEGWRADLVTICRAFHWLDQVTVLQHLDDHVAPDGAVAIFGDNSFWTAGSPLHTAVRSVIQNFLGQRRRAGQGTFNHHDWPYIEVMEESPFSVVEQFRVPVQRVWTTQSILGYLYSTSFAAPHLFGERLGQFERQTTTTLAGFSDNDTFGEDNEFLIRIGRRNRP